MRRLIEFHFI